MTRDLRNLWATEPIAIIGGIVFLITTVAAQLLDNGLVTSDMGKNIVHAIVGIAVALGTYFGRSQVTPA